MDNKGFTLVEMLATVVILGIVMGIATYGVISAIDKSKEKSEKLFVSKLEDVIQSYIGDNRMNWRTGTIIGNFIKCRRFNDDDSSCISDDDSRTANFYGINGDGLNNSSFSLNVLANERYIQGGVIKNPRNKLDCLSGGKNPIVTLYKDDDSVYYYYVDLRGDKTSCEIDDNVGIISNIPKNMCSKLSGYTWDRDVCVK